MQEMLSAIPLIPRRLLLGNPSQAAPQISPDGRMLSWLAPAGGVMNVWCAPADAPHEAAPVTKLSGRPIAWHIWSPDGRWVLFLKDGNGDENYNIYSVSPTGGEVRNLTPLPKVSAQLQLVSPDLPNTIFAGLNDRDPQWHDIWKIDLETGERSKIFENTERLGSIQLDSQGNLRFANRANPDNGGEDLFRFQGMVLENFKHIPFEDALTTFSGAINRAGTHFVMVSSIGRDTSALLRVDAATGEEQLLASAPEADVLDFMLHPETFEVVAAAYDPGRLTWTALNPDTGTRLDAIKGRFTDDDFTVGSKSRDDTRWVVNVWGPQKPVTYYLADRGTGEIKELFSSRPDLKPYQLAPMQAVRIKSRDGLTLRSYLSLPPSETGQRPAEPLPMVLLVHGGPWSRDSYGYNRIHQWLANRGYAVLSVNYRASSGFGKAFLNAGDKEHAGKIHDDLIDGVNWAIGEGIAQPDKVAIMGGSYGGYASFVAATFTPDVFCCSIPIVGITELITLLENMPPYWADFVEQMARRYADWRTEEGRAWLRERSPLYKADAITKPMLIGHGANDVRCPLSQSDVIVETMRKKGIPVCYVVFPDEGHGFARPENNIAFHAIAEAFLAKHMGGRAEPVGEDFGGSSHDIRADDGTYQGLQS